MLVLMIILGKCIYMHICVDEKIVVKGVCWRLRHNNNAQANQPLASGVKSSVSKSLNYYVSKQNSEEITEALWTAREFTPFKSTPLKGSQNTF